MRVLGFKRLRPALGLAFIALLPTGGQGQLRTVVSNEVAVSEKEATLKLDFQDRKDLTISLRGGQVFVDGEVVGTYVRRDVLDLAWRSLLGEVITLDDGPLAAALNDWDPPRPAAEGTEDLGALLDRTLEEALALPQTSGDPGSKGGISVSVEGQEGLLTALFSRSGALSGLAEAMQGVSFDNFTLKIGENVVVEAGDVLEGNLIVVDGNLDVRGTVVGDVVVTGGNIRLLDDGFISGDLRVIDGNLMEEGGEYGGNFLDLDTVEENVAEVAELEEMTKRLEAEKRALRSVLETERHRPSNVVVGILGNLGNAIAGLLENLVTFLVLAVLGVLAIHFQRERMEVIATTAYRAPVRSAVVGLAGGFFILPVWVLGIIALVITIIGIPVLLAWVPLFPIAAALAILLGYLAVARNVGEWVAEQEYRGLEWIRGSNTFYTVIAGVGALMVPAIAASVSRILGFGFLTGLLGFVSSLVGFAAAAVGLGAVLLTRGGKIRPLESYYDFEEDYWADTEVGEANEPAREEAVQEEVQEDAQPQPEGDQAGAAEGEVGAEDPWQEPDTEDSGEEPDEQV